MAERKRVGFGRSSVLKGTLLFTGTVFAAILLVYAAGGASSHHHDTGALQHAHAGCGGHGGHAHHGGECSRGEGEKDEECKLEKACPLLKGEKEEGNCPVKQLIGNKVVCPVMEDRTFTVTEDTIAVEHEGRIYLLCCPPCEDRFEADPGEHTGNHGESPGHGHEQH